MGFKLVGSLSSDDAVFSNDNCCKNKYIVGRKYRDNNCDGIVDAGDTVLPNWTFNLSGGSTNQTATTDIDGIFMFSNVQNGNYTISETLPTGWAATSPPGGSTNINVSNVYTPPLEFLNTDNPNCFLPTGEFCCEGDNLIRNGTFENGDTGFSSDYTSQAAGQSVNPGEYSVIDFNNANTICSDWNVQDHTNCITGNNNKIMVVNGQTQQTTFSTNVIWQTDQPISVERDSTYKFCAFVQHLPQCCFDMVPQLRVQRREGGSGPWNPIVANWQSIAYTGTTPPPCEWEEIGGTFTTSANTLEIRIILNEQRNGDGNDLALDDISLQKQSKPDFFLSHSFTGSPKKLTASISQLTSSDDLLPSPECNYWWLIAEANSFAPLNINWGTAMFGGSIFSSNWGLTTTFPTYNGSSPNGSFNPNKQYVAILNIYDCDCYAPHWEAEGVWGTNRRLPGKEKLKLTKADKRKIQARLEKELVKRKLIKPEKTVPRRNSTGRRNRN